MKKQCIMVKDMAGNKYLVEYTRKYNKRKQVLDVVIIGLFYLTIILGIIFMNCE